VKDYREVAKLRSDKDSEYQASRCMDCGTNLPLGLPDRQLHPGMERSGL
jgi:NADPH-dependent glutamate synthase beta subunit-like oxidoreductase